MRLFKVFLVLMGLSITTTVLTPKPVTLNKKIEATSEEIACLARNIYHEARSESLLGQIAVAQVTVNRALDPRFKGSLCKVVYSPSQFSWTLKRREVRDTQAYRRAVYIAHGVTSGTMWIEGFTATHYHTTKVNPRWNRTMKKAAVIGDHIFYD